MKEYLSLDPQEVNQFLWYYEENKGLNIVHEIRDSQGGYLRTDQILIPWSKIERTYVRYRKWKEAKLERSLKYSKRSGK